MFLVYFDEFLAISSKKNVFLSEIKIFDFGRFWPKNHSKFRFFTRVGRKLQDRVVGGGASKSQNFKTGQNVFKQPITII